MLSLICSKQKYRWFGIIHFISPHDLIGCPNIIKPCWSLSVLCFEEVLLIAIFLGFYTSVAHQISSDLQIYNFFMLIWEIQYEKSIQRIIQIF